MLYQGLEKLEKEKANREHLQMEIDVVSGSCASPFPGGMAGWERVAAGGGMDIDSWEPVSSLVDTWGKGPCHGCLPAEPSCSSSEQKADKSALASKVSRVQFDATTEQLNHMMQELMAKMSGQEQDWQKLLDKLLAAMDMKVRAGEAAAGGASLHY